MNESIAAGRNRLRPDRSPAGPTRVPARHHGVTHPSPIAEAQGIAQDSPADSRSTLAGLTFGTLIATAMVIGSGVLILLASGFAFAAALLSPLTGLVTLVFVSPLPRPLVVPTPGLYVALLAVILIGTILRLPVDRPRLRAPSMEVTLISAYLVYVAANFLGFEAIGIAGPREASIASLFSSLTTAVLTFVIARLVVRDRSAVPVLAAVLASAVLVSLVAFAEHFDAAEPISGLLKEPNVLGRITGPFADPNYFGAYLATAVTIALAAVVIARSVRLKVVLTALALFVGGALMLTLSRGAIAALIVGLATLAFTRSLKSGLATVMSMIFVAVLAWPLFVEMRFGAGSELMSAGLGTQIESSGRIETWLAGVQTFLSAPVFGVGWGRFVDEASTGIAAHNWFIAVMAETGFVGLLLWVLFIAAVALGLRRRPRSARSVGYSVLAVWLVASLTIEVPTAYGVTGPAVAVLAAALAAKWPEREDRRAAPVAPSSPVRGRRELDDRNVRQLRPGMRP